MNVHLPRRRLHMANLDNLLLVARPQSGATREGIMRAIIVVMVMMMALPAQAHTEAEQEDWREAWAERAETRITPKLMDEWVDFHSRHLVRPQPARRAAAPSTYRGIGSNVEQWRGLVSTYFSNVPLAMCILAHESGGSPNARNPSSGAAGLFQIMPFWWDHFGGDRYDPETNVRTAAKILELQGWTAWSPYNRGAC